MNRAMWTSALPLLLTMPLVGLFGGCASYEYDLVRPVNEAGHIGSNDWRRFSLDDIEYRLKTSDDRLVIDVFNRSEESLKLIGDDSAVVDPKGESHPLRTRAIPSASFVRLVLPPRPPTVRSSGPTFGFGVGVGGGSRFRHRGFGYGGFGESYEPWPSYYALYDSSDSTFWSWEGSGTETRVVLAFDRGKQSFQHEFLFRRIKK